MVHAARANMASQSGLATPSKFGVRACLGTDVMALDILAEAQLATLRSIEVGQPLNLLRLLANGHRLASEAFGATLAPELRDRPAALLADHRISHVNRAAAEADARGRGRAYTPQRDGRAQGPALCRR